MALHIIIAVLHVYKKVFDILATDMTTEDWDAGPSTVIIHLQVSELYFTVCLGPPEIRNIAPRNVWVKVS